MKVTFTRGEGLTYTTMALRDDGVLLRVPSHDRTSLLPHDLAHLIVEQGLQLKRGFWGCVAAGALFPGMTVVSGRQAPHAAARSRAILREAGQQGTEAEVLVAVLSAIHHERQEDDPAAVRAALAGAWRPSQPSRDLPDHKEVQCICAALRGAQAQWQDLEAGQSLTFTWTMGPTDKRGKQRR